jgi:hypothetical protein
MQEHRSLNQASPRVEREEQLDSASTYIFEFTLKRLLHRRLNESIHMKRLCIVL